MSIADKLTTISENVAKVYEAGKAEGGGGAAVDPDKVIEKTVSGTFISVDDVSEVQHKCKVVVQTGEESAELSVCGKNLFDISKVTTNGSSVVNNGNGTLTVTERGKVALAPNTLKDYAPCLQIGQKYTLSAKCTHTGNFIYLRGLNKSWFFGTSLVITEEILSSTVLWYNSTADGDVTENIISDIQIEHGATVTEYEAYTCKTYTATSNVEVEIESVCPYMNVCANTEDAFITMQYHKSWGMQAEYDRFWDDFQQNGARDYYRYVFSRGGWTGENFKPKYDIILKATQATYLFLESTNLNIDLAARMQELGIKFVFDNFTNAAEMFNNSAVLHIGELDFSKVDTSYRAFYNAKNLHTIDKLICSETTNWSATLYGCTALENLTIEGMIGQNGFSVAQSPLTHESLMSILNALKDLTADGSSLAVTLGADNLAKLTDAEKLIATQKGWTLA